MAANIASEWDFCGTDTRYMTHCVHAYPAMMIPQIAEQLILRFGGQAKLLFDPYCGTGSSLLEANIHGINAVGTDLNPLARLIARAKTTRLNRKKTEEIIRSINTQLLQARFASHKPTPPPVKNIDFWFSPKAQHDLAIVGDLINNLLDDKIRCFCAVAFSETVRECSYTRNGEFKLYRMPAARREKFTPDAFGVFMSKLARNFLGMKKYLTTIKKAGRSHIFDFDTVCGIPQQCLSPQSVDIVITSPPYGDSKTTVAYGQFSRFANEWLGHNNAAAVDKTLMGGTPKNNSSDSLGCKKLDDAIAQIAQQHPARAREIRAFYEDYRRSIKHVAQAVRVGGIVCYVVGNRKSKGVVLPTDVATTTYFVGHGYKKIAAFVRNIPNKRMPSKNSPSNITGVCDVTMQQEHILVMQKI